ncbi:DUF6703 family protein [Kribbella deserti]|uniref:DUF6703 family protein n=1 Tax=Kribbella deserti TaxID=1926257 RepID=A0ABV6QFG4_9ACTN
MSSANASQPTGPVSPLRARITKASYPLIARLHGMPKLTLPIITLLLVVIGAFAPVAAGVPALILLAALLAWLGFLSWPVVSGGSKALRIFAVLVVGFFAISRIVSG